jgi:hypothetical protein
MCAALLLTLTTNCKKEPAAAKGDVPPVAMSSGTEPPRPQARPSALPERKIPKPPATLTLAKVEATFGKGGLAIDENGTVKFAGKEIAKVTADGKLLIDGKQVLSMAEDGTVEIDPAINSKNKTLEIAIDGTATVDGDPFLRVDENGKLWEHKSNGQPDQEVGSLSG